MRVDGRDKVQRCQCVAPKRIAKLMSGALIPDAFAKAEFNTYLAGTTIQANMLRRVQEYVKLFDDLRGEEKNSFGFVAVYGESRIRAVKNPNTRAELETKHNNWGLGKTHLSVAAAKALIRRGYSVVVVSDVVFMDDLAFARTGDDEGKKFTQLLNSVINADLLIWDDLGKNAPTDFRLRTYYRIIDERSRQGKPVMFSTNEDMESLVERIGHATASRLYGMCGDRLYEVEGPDFRTTRRD